MDLVLLRSLPRGDGVFGTLHEDIGDNKVVAVTLEHAYEQKLGIWTSKLQPGTYLCQRGQHQLHSMPTPFETFEITGVTGHTNILFHVGNYNEDSDGCVLLGKYLNKVGPKQMIGLSKRAFQEFMTLQQGVDQFTLTVKDI